MIPGRCRSSHNWHRSTTSHIGNVHASAFSLNPLRFMQKAWRLVLSVSGTSETSKTSAHCILRCWNMCHCDHKMYHKDLAQFISPRESLQPLGMRWCDDATNMQGQTTQNRWIVTLDSRRSRCSVRRVKKCLPNDDWNWQLQFHEYNRTQSLTRVLHSNT